MRSINAAEPWVAVCAHSDGRHHHGEWFATREEAERFADWLARHGRGTRITQIYRYEGRWFT